LFIGLFVASIGLDNPGGIPRFTMGNTDLMSGVDFIPAMIGLFAVSEVIRTMAAGAKDWDVKQTSLGNPLRGWGTMFIKYWPQQLRATSPEPPSAFFPVPGRILPPGCPMP